MNKKILETLEFNKVKALFEPHLLTEQGLEQLRQLAPTAKADKIKQSFAEMKEMQALCLDMQVLDEEQNVVEITEDLYDANQDMHRLLSGGDYRTEKQENFGALGYIKQEFKDGELVDSDEENDTVEELSDADAEEFFESIASGLADDGEDE